MTPTLLFPFAAPRVAGDLSDAGARAETEMRVLLWSVERLIGGLSTIGRDTDVDTSLHVVLPGSPNRGLFGGDGAYGESKAALDAVVARWKAERTWAERVTLVHALIGWVRGTGLMGHNDPLVDAVEQAGVQTWSTAEMAELLLRWCTAQARERAAEEPCIADFTGGLAKANLDLPALGKQAAEQAEAADDGDAATDSAAVTIAALPAPPTASSALPVPEWGEVTADPAELVVIVGTGELGPYGSARTRFEMEVDEQLSAAGVLELAWTTGMVTWENDPKPGWYDTESGDLVPESEISERYHDAVVARCGIRRYEDFGAMVDGTAPLLTSVFLDKDLSFVVTSEAEARAFESADPEHTVVVPVPDSVGLAGDAQGGHRDSGAAQGEADPYRRRPDSDRVRPDPLGNLGRYGGLGGPGCIVEHHHDGGCLHQLWVQPGRADELGAPEHGGQHAGHRHGRHAGYARALYRRAAR